MTIGHNEKTTNARSWVVVTRNKKPVVIGTNWVPGYTPGHKATPTEAVDYAIRQRAKARIRLLAEMQALVEMNLED